jgi:signal transduction histidine kinase
MNSIKTNLFPLPILNNDKKCTGSIIRMPDLCENCKTLICQVGKPREIGLCSYGYNYYKVDEKSIIIGILLKDSPQTSKARSKRMRSGLEWAITRKMLEYLSSVLESAREEFQEEIQDGKKDILEKYVKENLYKKDFLDEVREDIQKALAFVHDYKQINTRINQNINVIIEKKYEGNTLEEKLEKVTQEEKAIYMASKLLDEKLNVAKFLMNPEWLDKQDGCVESRFHGIVLKYKRIYEPIIESKGLNIVWLGESYSSILANYQAISVIPHTLIDNAIKYSPKSGTIEIYIQDVENGIDFSVSSFGPSLCPGEEEKIFRPFYRGQNARAIEEEGAGYGLYISQLIAKRHLGTEITVEQESRNTPRMGHWTKFIVHFPLKAIILF